MLVPDDLLDELADEYVERRKAAKAARFPILDFGDWLDRQPSVWDLHVKKRPFMVGIAAADDYLTNRRTTWQTNRQ